MSINESRMSSSRSHSYGLRSYGKLLKRGYNKYLPDDVWFEIFLLLPLKSIYKYRCVSKQWHSLLSDTSFLNRYRIIHNNSFTPLMLFYNLEYSIYTEVSIKLLMDNGFKFVSDHDGFSFKFLSNRCPGKKPNTYLLASSNGLVLCSNRLTKQITYFVCNPVTRKWVSLGRRKPRFRHEWVLNGFICESSTTSLVPPILLSENRKKNKKKPSTSFMVVRIPGITEPSTDFNIEIFYSEIGEWKAFNVSCPQQVTLLPSSSNRIVNCNGVLYWFEGGNRIIAYNLNYNNNNKVGENGDQCRLISFQCRLISLPEETTDNNRCLGESEGLIYYCQCKLGKLSVWVLDQDYLTSTGWNWRSVHKIETKYMLPEKLLCPNNMDDWVNLNLNLKLKPLAINPVDPNVVFLRELFNIFSYNIKTRRYKVLRSPDSKHFAAYARDELLPFVLVPWPTTF